MRTDSAAILRSALNGCMARGTLDRFLASLSAHELTQLHFDFELWAREDQLPPPAAQGGGAWTTWLMLGGRGAGKTRAGAEWVRSLAADFNGEGERPRIALVGETFADARSVMVEGVSGLLAVHPPGARPSYEPSKRQVTFANGAVAQLFSADDPEGLRGPQFSAAWCDELCKWRRPDETFDMLQFGLRLGTRPRQMVTTTPRPTKLIKRLMADASTALTRVATDANAVNLAPSFLSAIVGRYRGTRLGRQELDAELLEDRPDSLWPRALIETCRVAVAPDLKRIVVGVDPPVSSGERADGCGIVVAGLGGDGRCYVLADATVDGARPLQWANKVIAAYRRFGADRVVVEVNQGGELVETVLREIDASVPVRAVRAMRGKWLRAAAFLLALDDSTNATRKGGAILTRATNEAQASFNITAVTDATGYVKVAVSGHAGATSFSAADPISFQFARDGDKGADGAGGDVVGPASATDGHAALFDGATGKLLKSAGSAPILNSLLTTRGDIVARGASVPARLALGAAGTFLRSDGTDAAWALAGLNGIQLLTASGTYTPTAGTKSALVLVQAAGAGGGGVGTTTGEGVAGSGAAGETRLYALTNVSGTYSFTIGAAGSGAAAGNNAGSTASTRPSAPDRS